MDTEPCSTRSNKEATPEKTDEIQAVDGFYDGRERSLSRNGNRIVVRDIERRRNSSLPGQNHVDYMVIGVVRGEILDRK